MFKKTFVAGCMIAAASAETNLVGRQFVLEPLDGQAPVLIEFDENNQPEMLWGEFFKAAAGFVGETAGNAINAGGELIGGAFKAAEEGTKGAIDIVEALARKGH